MVRSTCAALLLIAIAAPAAGQNMTADNAWRVRDTTIDTPRQQLPAIEVGNFGRFGVGIFGLKSQTPRSRAVTVREVSEPRERRAGVGFSMKF